jgi:hypothetical protein
MQPHLELFDECLVILGHFKKIFKMIWIKRIRDVNAEKTVLPSLEELEDSAWIMTVDGINFMTWVTHPGPQFSYHQFCELK